MAGLLEWKNGAAVAYTHSRTMYLEQDDRISVKYLHTDNQDLPLNDTKKVVFNFKQCSFMQLE